MDNSKNLTGLGAIAVSLVTTLIVLGLGLLIGGKGDAAITPAQQNAIEQHVAQLIVPMLPKAGALSSPALGPWYSVSDIEVDGWNCAFDFTGTATSSACSMGPILATSTYALTPTLRIATEPYVNTWTIWRAATPATETTKLAQDLVASANGVIHATTTTTSLTDGILVPGSYINCRVATTTTVNANFNATGRCEAATRVL